MSWLVPTVLLLIGGFAIAFGFCEWFIARRPPRDRNGDDGPALG
jgi:hypothetical protein